MNEKLNELYRLKLRNISSYLNYVNEIAEKWCKIKPYTETNISYRLNDSMRWKETDSVIGIEVTTRCNCITCKTLSGKYPKDFIFIGFHPECICNASAILLDDENSAKYFLHRFSNKYSTDFDINEHLIDDIPDSVIPYFQQNIKNSTDPYFLELNNMFYLYIQMKVAENNYNLKKNA